MPRKPRKNKGIRRPGPTAPIGRKQAWCDQENRRLEAQGSPWRYWVNQNTAVCLVAADNE